MGVQKAFQKYYPDTKIILMQPAESAKEHGIQGVNDGEDFLVNKSKIDGIIKIKTEEAKERAKKLARESGLFVGISSGANVLAAERWIEKNEPDGIVVTILCDRGERYFSCF
jgi:cysteine synthase